MIRSLALVGLLFSSTALAEDVPVPTTLPPASETPAQPVLTPPPSRYVSPPFLILHSVPATPPPPPPTPYVAPQPAPVPSPQWIQVSPPAPGTGSTIPQ